MRIPMCQVRCLNYLFWDWICSIWFLCHCELIHSVEESYLEGQAQEAPCLQETPCGKLVWRWSKDGPSVLCVTTRHHSLMQKNVGVWYFLFRKLLWSRVTIELKANPIRPESKHHDEPIELPFKSVWSCVMRETYQVALLGLYKGYWWYVSSLPYERAAMQHGASPNSSGDLAQFVCKIRMPKKVFEKQSNSMLFDFVWIIYTKESLLFSKLKNWTKRFIISTPHAPHVRQDTRQETLNQ